MRDPASGDAKMDGSIGGRACKSGDAGALARVDVGGEQHDRHVGRGKADARVDRKGAEGAER